MNYSRVPNCKVAWNYRGGFLKYVQIDKGGEFLLSQNLVKIEHKVNKVVKFVQT